MGSDLYKYPRTLHLPWSPGVSNDDKVMHNIDTLSLCEVVVLEKRDGECTTMYSDHIHARSIDSGPHRSRHYVKAIHGQIKHSIPKRWRICGENLHYTKSIRYRNLTSFFEVFSIWNEENVCLSWAETVLWCETLGLSMPPVIYCGPFDKDLIKGIKINPKFVEGYVIRPVFGFSINLFSELVGKYVREGHVQTDEHWMNQELRANTLIRK